MVLPTAGTSFSTLSGPGCTCFGFKLTKMQNQCIRLQDQNQRVATGISFALVLWKQMGMQLGGGERDKPDQGNQVPGKQRIDYVDLVMGPQIIHCAL